MSGLIPFGVSIAEAAIQGLIGPIFVRQRMIGGLIANVTVRETHDDELVVTENPVEYGAAVTDHSFKQPVHLTVEVGYSNSSVQSGGDPNYINDAYAQFLQLQASREPFDVITGKRQYTDMLITGLHTMTDQASENILLLTVKMKQVILVSTQTVSVPPAANMKTPQDTGATQSQGTQQLTGVPSTGGVTGSVAGATGGTPGATAFNYTNAPFTSAWSG